MTDELSREQWEQALRRFGWLRDDGDGERLHTTRPPLKPEVLPPDPPAPPAPEPTA